MTESHFTCKSHRLASQHIREYPRSTAHSSGDELLLEVKEYTPKHVTNASAETLTVIAAHACGMPKELYEPLWDDLQQFTTRAGISWRIGSVWIADMANHGMSSRLNEGRLGNEPSWDDHARDLLHMVNHFRDQMHPPIIGIGHSMGATQLTKLASIHPSLFTAIVNIEAILVRAHSDMNFAALYQMTYKNDRWPSREAAIEEARRFPPFQSWDHRVFSSWTKTGYRDLPALLPSEEAADSNQGVTLATSRDHELTAFAKPALSDPAEKDIAFRPIRNRQRSLWDSAGPTSNVDFYRPEAILTYQQLAYLRPSCLYIYGERTPFRSNKGTARQEKQRITGTLHAGSGGTDANAVTTVEIKHSGHYAPLEKPSVVAHEIASWISMQHPEWRRSKEGELNSWSDLPSEEKARVHPDWDNWINKRFPPKVDKYSGSKL